MGFVCHALRFANHLSGVASGNSFGPVANSEHRIVSQLWWARRWAWALDLSIAVVENSAVVWIRLGSGRSIAFVSLALSTGRPFGRFANHLSGAASGNSFGPVANSEDWVVSQVWWARRWAWALDLSIAVVENSAVVWIRLGSGRSVAFVSLALSTGRSFWGFTSHLSGAASGYSFGPVANSEHRIVSQLWWARRWAWALDLSIAVVENSAVVWIRLGSGRSVAFVSLALSTG